MAIEEIEELGASLLQRQRTTRKRTQKRKDKDKRNALWLAVAEQGVSLANNYLRERSTNFINNNEELMGQRLLYQRALKNKERIITEYGEAQAHATGVEGWLAENKFAPIIQANIERTFKTRGYSKQDIQNMVLDRARVEAAKYKTSYEKAYDEALKIGTIEDYDAYIRSRDGRAENVGGFLFNKISRSLNETTQEDIDQEMIKSIRTNRFSKNALQLAFFDSHIKAGARVQDAKDLSYTAGRGSERRTLEDLGIGKAELNIESIVPAQVNFKVYGKEYTVNLSRYNWEDETGKVVKSNYGPMWIQLENGEEVIQDPEMFNLWVNQQGPDIFIDPTRRVIDSPEYMQAQLDSGAWYLERTASQTEKFTGEGAYNRAGTTYTYNVVDKRGNIVTSIERTTHVSDLTHSTKMKDIDQTLVNTMIPYIEQALEMTRIPGMSKSLGDVEAFALYLYQNRDRLDDAIDQNVDLAGKITRGMAVFAREAAVRAQDIIENYPGIGFYRASQLAATGAVVPLAYSYNDDEESVLHQENFFDPGRIPAINILLAESILSTGSRGAEGTDTNWAGVSPQTMEKMAFEAFNELKNLRNVPGETNYYKRNAAEALRQVKGFEKIVVPASVLNIEPKEGALNPDGTEQVNPFDAITNAGFLPTNWKEYVATEGAVDPGVFTFEDLIKFEMGEESSRTEKVVVDAVTGTGTTPLEELSMITDTADLGGGTIKDAQRLINKMTEPGPVGKWIGDKVAQGFSAMIEELKKYPAIPGGGGTGRFPSNSSMSQVTLEQFEEVWAKYFPPDVVEELIQSSRDTEEDNNIPK